MSRKTLEDISGRTLLEMLAVLALIAIISVAAASFYKRVMVVHRANTIYDDIRVRAVLSTAKRWRKNTPEQMTSSSGIPLTLIPNTPTQGYFLIKADSINQDICKQLLQKKWPADNAQKSGARIYINDLPYPTGISACPEGTSSFAVARRSVLALENNLPKTCTTTDTCEACEGCLNGECKPWCPEGQFCHEHDGEKKCVQGTCNKDTGLCCPNTMDLCTGGEEPAGTESQCPCFAKQEGSQCKSCDAAGHCQDDDRWCGDHGVCTNGSCGCETNYARIFGVCSPSTTVLANGCTAGAPSKKNGDCKPCTINRGMAIFKEGTETTNTSVNYACEEVCPNRTFHSNRCGGASSNQLGICALTTAPAGKPLLGCTGEWRACPTGNASEQPAVKNDCYTNCSSDQTFITGAYCQSCDRTSTTYVTKAYNTQNSNANRCPNRIWDTTQCQNKINNTWVKCGENGLLSECTGGTSNIQCLYRLKTACEMINCGEHATCSAGECICDEGYTSNGNQCVLTSCGGVTCTGATTCVNEKCVCTGYMDHHGCHACPDNATCDGTNGTCNQEGYYISDNGVCEPLTKTCGTQTCTSNEFCGHRNENISNGYPLTCISCDSEDGWWVEDISQCSSCANREMSLDVAGNERKVCGLKTCPSNKPFKENGWCQSCNQNGARLVDDSVTHCVASCENTKYKRKLIGSWCAYQECAQENEKFFYLTNNDINDGKLHQASGCGECSMKGSVRAPKEACDLCGSLRKMDGDNCVCAGYIADNACKACPEHGVCDGATITGCDAEYRLDGVQCVLSVACEGYWDNSECKPCPENATCPNNVITCNGNYGLDGNTCVACPPNSISCDNGVIVCKEGYQLDENDECIEKNGQCNEIGRYWDERNNTCQECPVCTGCSTQPACNGDEIEDTCPSNKWMEVIFAGGTNGWSLEDRKIDTVECVSCTDSTEATVPSWNEGSRCSGVRFLAGDSKGDPKSWRCAGGTYIYPASSKNPKNKWDKSSCNACPNRQYNEDNKRCECDAAHAYNSNKNCCGLGKVANDSKTACIDDCSKSGCGDHGQCEKGVCQCTDGYTGVKCNIAP